MPTDAQGFKVAIDGRMQQEATKLVRVIKDYSVFQPNPQSTDSDKLRHANVDIGYLRGELSRLESRCERLQREIESEAKMLAAALKGEQETYDQVKRRISRLKGALDYPGHG